MNEGFEFGLRHHGVDQAHPQGFLCAITARGKQHLGGGRWPDELRQALDSLGLVAQAKPGCRNSELGVIGRITQVCVECDRRATAYAKSVDHRDDRLRGAGQGRESAAVERRVLRRAVCVSRFFELGDVRTGHEGDVARAAQDDDSYLGVAVQLCHRSGDRSPHRGIDRVSPLDLIEGQPADPSISLCPNVSRHGARR